MTEGSHMALSSLRSRVDLVYQDKTCVVWAFVGHKLETVQARIRALACNTLGLLGYLWIRTEVRRTKHYLS